MDQGALVLTLAHVWDYVLPETPNREWMTRCRRLATEAERRRKDAAYQTGSILESEAYDLIALAEAFQARTVVEVGTFVGLSTKALASASTVETVYTCDVSNDCLPSDDKIRTYAKKTSTEMLRHLVKKGVRADLCFFDGTLSPVDVDLLFWLTTPQTVYALHDYGYQPKVRKDGRVETVPRKGIGNLALLRSKVIGYVLVEPQPESSLALFIPESRR